MFGISTPISNDLKDAEKIVKFYERVIARTARLAAQWMAAGFVHGVLNTDNMNVTGESFDYGPWRFAPTADPAFTAAYFDQTGLYAFGRQTEAAAWNLSRLGGCFALIAETDALNEALATYPAALEKSMVDAFFLRLGIERTGTDDIDLVAKLLSWMEETRAPYEQVFFDWFCGPASERRAAKSPLAAHYGEENFAEVRKRLLSATPERPERLNHAHFNRAAPTTMLIDEVEAIWAPIAANDDWSMLEAKLVEVRSMRDAFGFQASVYGESDDQ